MRARVGNSALRTSERSGKFPNFFIGAGDADFEFHQTLAETERRFDGFHGTAAGDGRFKAVGNDLNVGAVRFALRNDSAACKALSLQAGNGGFGWKRGRDVHVEAHA